MPERLLISDDRQWLVHELRTKFNFRQYEIAAKLGISPSLLSSYLTGRPDTPMPDRIYYKLRALYLKNLKRYLKNIQKEENLK